MMNRKILFMGLTLSILVIAISTHQIMAQNVITNASNAVGNMTAAANQTGSELGQNTSVLNNAGDKVGSALGELKQNMSEVGTELGQNMSEVGTELGQNMSEVGTEILNKTEEAAKKVGTGAADVLSNISGEIKEGINGK